MYTEDGIHGNRWYANTMTTATTAFFLTLRPSLVVFSPADSAADAVEFEVERLSETLLGAAGLSGSGGGGHELWSALVAGSQGASWYLVLVVRFV